jgi:thiol-disulfide isomerase/thioredoxin
MLFISALQIPAMATGIKFENIGLEQALSKAKEQNKLVFIDIYATWCGPCKYLSKVTFKDESLGEFMNEHFINIKLDGEKGDGDQLMVDFELNSFPTMLILDPERALKKKMIGASDAEELISEVRGVVFPEETAIFQMTQNYNNGERSREFLSEFIVESLNEDKEFEAITNEFIELYPDIDLHNENEFIVFCIGINDRSHSLAKEFVSNIDKIANTHGKDIVSSKLDMLIVEIVNEAFEKKDPSHIDTEVESIYKTYKSFNGKDALSKRELIQILHDLYES